MRRLAAGVIAVLLFLGTVGTVGTSGATVAAGPDPAPGSATPSLTFPYPEPCKYCPYGAYAIFNEPAANATVTPNIQNELIRLIDNTPRGSAIYAIQAYLTYPGVVSALKNARGRGVYVEVIVPRGTYDPSLPNAGFQYFGVCPPAPPGDGAAGGCNGSQYLHNKNWLFSTSKTKDGVTRGRITVTGSLQASGSTEWNNIVVTYGNDPWYYAYYNLFGKLKAVIADPGLRNPDFNATDDGFFTDDTASNGTGSGWSVQFAPHGNAARDPVANALRRITAHEPGCSLLVAESMFYDQRIAVANELTRIADLGCTVRVVFHNMDEPVWNVLNGHTNVTLEHFHDSMNNSPSGAVASVHSKFLVYKGSYAGTAGQKIVWTGSHNTTWSSLYTSDEDFAMFPNSGPNARPDQLFDEFTADFQRMWNASVCPGTDNGGTDPDHRHYVP